MSAGCFTFIIQLNQKKKIMHASLLNPVCKGINTNTANRKELEDEWQKIGLEFFEDGFEHEKMLDKLLSKYNIKLETLLETPELKIKDPREVYLEHMKNVKKSKEELKDFTLTPDNFMDIFFESKMVKKPNMMLREMLEKGIRLK